jgi:hypothetical protein
MTSYNSPFDGQVIQPTDVSYRAITLSANTTLSWPINGNATDNYAARIMDVTATAGSLELAMPPANQTSVGTDALIRNVGATSFEVTDFDGNSIAVIAAGKAEYIYITDNPDTAGTWGIIAFGTGSSSADAVSLAGFGLLASSGKLNQSHPISGLSDGITFSTVDLAQGKVWNGGAGEVFLPPATSLGTSWFTLLKNNGTGTLTVTCNGIETLDGSVSKNFAPNESAFILCTGSSYITVGYGVSNLFNFTALVKPISSGTYNLTANEISNTIQEFVGTLTGNVTVVYPPVVNLYVVSNQTIASGYSLTLTTGSGAVAVVPSGNQATVFCDGTNFYNANTVQAGASSLSLVDGTVSTPPLNFALETNTGIYRIGAGQMGITVLGNQIVAFTANGINVTGTGNFSNGVPGGSF